VVSVDILVILLMRIFIGSGTFNLLVAGLCLFTALQIDGVWSDANYVAAAVNALVYLKQYNYDIKSPP